MDGDQLQLFGAKRGRITRTNVEIFSPGADHAWQVRLTCECEMRRKPMIVIVHDVGGIGVDKPAGEFTAIALKAYWCRGEVIQVHILRAVRKLLSLGYDVDSSGISERIR